MTTIKILGAAAILAYALASPAMAQQVTSGNYQRPAFADQANRQSGTWQNSYNRWDGRTGFGPGNSAAGTAAGTASAWQSNRSAAKNMPAATASSASPAPCSAAKTAAGTSANRTSGSRRGKRRPKGRLFRVQA